MSAASTPRATAGGEHGMSPSTVSRAPGGSRRPPGSLVGRVQPRTAFVLSGGASLGALQVGMLRALYERGVVPDLLVGTSAGALNAAFVASRPQTPATADQLARIWRALRREDVFAVSARALIGGVMSHRDHLFPDRGLSQLVRAHLEIEQLEEAQIPLHLVAHDLLSGDEVRLSHGPASAAVLAATAIPGLLPPVRWGDRLLIDGGVVNNTPISHAVELGAERIYVLPTQQAAPALPTPPRGALDAAIHGLTLLVGARLEADIARYTDHVELIVQGDDDLMIPTKLSYLMAGLIPHAEIRIYPDAAHASIFQYPEEAARDIDAFLDSLNPAMENPRAA